MHSPARTRPQPPKHTRLPCRPRQHEQHGVNHRCAETSYTAGKAGAGLQGQPAPHCPCFRANVCRLTAVAAWASAQATGEATSACGNTGFLHSHRHTRTFPVGALAGQRVNNWLRLCFRVPGVTSVTTVHGKIPILHTQLWPRCEPHFPVICPERGFYFSSGESTECVGGKHLSTGIHLIHFTSRTLLNPEPEVCACVYYGVADRKCVPREMAKEKLHEDSMDLPRCLPTSPRSSEMTAS